MFKKILVVLTTIATLGMYTPTALLEVQADEPKDSLPKENLSENSTNVAVSIQQEEPIDIQSNQKIHDKEYFINDMINQAKDQTMAKFGPRMVNKVEDEFTDQILPAMESVLATLVEDAGDDYIHYEITESPSKGYGEKIFHVYDHRKGQDVARFDVRRDNRPLEGYFFNFHYHLSKDGFNEHHEIGDLYWDKNIPPKWMA
ncbi:YpjP family protein [Oceanobacillus sp. Castelsardo]|uniref:YpjP family protein n=1 Tax=Oceanobacillus sp. Castelsardo TaxID=1851204 RepID=UPI001E3E906F|nr:YpjP family protein [Oceanobacillus sp. Castelsardo]